MDNKKFKYDFSLLCALADFLKEPDTIQKRADFDMRIYMIEKFESYYQFFSMLDESYWENLKNLD